MYDNPRTQIYRRKFVIKNLMYTIYINIGYFSPPKEQLRILGTKLIFEPIGEIETKGYLKVKIKVVLF